MKSRRKPSRKRTPGSGRKPSPAPVAPDSVSSVAGAAAEPPPVAAPRGRPFPRGNDVAKRYWFKPGQSGNPGGVPATVQEFREEVRKRTMAVLDRLDDVLDHGTEEGIIRASRELFANAWSKPTLRVEASGPGGGPIAIKTVLTSDERRARAAALLAKATGLKKSGDDDPGESD
jgi:hypothetical protein